MNCSYLEAKTLKTYGLTGVEILSAAINRVLENKDQYNVLSILQSSGFGKSKAFYDLGKYHYRTVLSPCLESNTGIQEIPDTIRTMANYLRDSVDADRCKRAGKLILTLCSAAQSYSSI